MKKSVKKYVIFVTLLPLIFGLVACASGAENYATPPTEPTEQGAGSGEQGAGSGVETSLPPSLPVDDRTREEVLAALYAQKDTLKLCDEVFDRDYSQSASQVFSLDEQTYLMQVGCFSAAYQANFEFWQYEKTESGVTFTPLMLTSFNQNSSGDPIREETKTLAGLATYSPATRSLNIFTKFRGIGDCGSMADYQLKNGKFELVKYQAKFDCDGNYVEPDDYPQIFP